MTDPQDGLFPNPRGEQGALSMPDSGDADQQAPVQPLDVQQVFAEATSYQVRR